MYSQSAQTIGRRRQADTFRPGRGGRRRQQQTVTPARVRARMVQLLVCLALFLAVYVGKGVFPQRLEAAGRDLLRLMGSNTDFHAAFSALGQSLADEDSILGEIGQFCVEVFGGSAQEPAVPVLGSVLQEGRFPGGRPDAMTLASRYIRQEPLSAEWFRPTMQEPLEESAPEEIAAETEVVVEPPVLLPPAGTVLQTSGYSGRELPEGFTMDWLSLGELETVTPVFGPVHSEYGYRDHPVNGSYAFHQGIDIGGYVGDPVRAFAAGTVEYIGENDTYGMYFRIDHGNGVKSFYAHCSKLLIRKDQQVEAGEVVARVGSTGTATGPHLHLELRWQDTHVNPIYYIDYRKS